MNQVATTNNNKLQTFGKDEVWGAAQSIEAQDILIPKLNLMQQLSEAVENEQAKSGEFVENVGGEVKGTELEVIVVDSFKSLQIWEDGKWKETIDWKPEYRDRKFEEMVNGKVIKNMAVLSYYVLFVSDLKAAMPIPYVLPFKSSAMKTGRQIASEINKLKMFKAPSAAVVFKIGRVQKENSKGKFWVPTAVKLRNSSAAEVAAAKTLYSTIKKANVEVQEDVVD